MADNSQIITSNFKIIKEHSKSVLKEWNNFIKKHNIDSIIDDEKVLKIFKDPGSKIIDILKAFGFFYDEDKEYIYVLDYFGEESIEYLFIRSIAGYCLGDVEWKSKMWKGITKGTFIKN